MNNENNNMPAKCPFCKGEVNLKDVKTQVSGAGFFKQEIMYSCPHCQSVLGFSRGKYMS